MRKRSSYIAILLLGIFLYQYLGGAMCFQWGINELKESFSDSSQMEEMNISSDIASDPSRFVILNQHEFMLDGQIYDFTSCQKKGNVFCFQCSKDINEQKLIVGFGQHINANSDNGNNSTNKILKISLQDFTIPVITNCTAKTQSAHYTFKPYQFFGTIHHQTLEVPPPRTIA